MRDLVFSFVSFIVFFYRSRAIGSRPGGNGLYGPMARRDRSGYFSRQISSRMASVVNRIPRTTYQFFMQLTITR